MIVGILGFKGGVGKTTAAIHLAAFLNQQAPACLIDSDPNQSALNWAGKGLLPFPVVGEEETAKAARKYDHLVIDCKARPTREAIKALQRGSDLLILPTTPDGLAIEALLLTVEALGDIERERFRVLLNICPPAPSNDPEQARGLLKKAGLPIFNGQIRRAVAFQRAAVAGCLVAEIADDRAPLAAGDYEGIGAEILESMKGTQ